MNNNLSLKTSSKINNKDLLALFLIMLVAFLLRFWGLDLACFSTYDDNYIWHDVQFFRESGVFPSVGGYILASNVYNARIPGGFFYSLLLTVSFIVNSPTFSTGLISLLGLLAVLFSWIFVRKFFGVNLAYITAIFFATSPLAVEISRRCFNPHMIPLFAVFFYFSLFSLVLKKNSQWIIILSFFLILIFQCHLSAILLLFLTLVVLLIWKIKINLKHILIVFLIALFLYLPWIINEIKHFGLETQKIIMAFRANYKDHREKETNPIIKPWSVITMFPMPFLLTLNRIYCHDLFIDMYNTEVLKKEIFNEELTVKTYGDTDKNSQLILDIYQKKSPWRPDKLGQICYLPTFIKEHRKIPWKFRWSYFADTLAALIAEVLFIIGLITSLWRAWQHYQQKKLVHNVWALLAFAVIFICLSMSMSYNIASSAHFWHFFIPLQFILMAIGIESLSSLFGKKIGWIIVSIIAFLWLAILINFRLFLIKEGGTLSYGPTCRVQKKVVSIIAKELGSANLIWQPDNFKTWQYQAFFKALPNVEDPAKSNLFEKDILIKEISIEGVLSELIHTENSSDFIAKAKNLVFDEKSKPWFRCYNVLVSRSDQKIDRVIPYVLVKKPK